MLMLPATPDEESPEDNTISPVLLAEAAPVRMVKLPDAPLLVFLPVFRFTVPEPIRDAPLVTDNEPLVPVEAPVATTTCPVALLAMFDVPDDKIINPVSGVF